MKYKEFREYLKGTDFEIKEDSAKVQVNMNDIVCVRISKTACREIIIPFTVVEPEEYEMLKKALELAETPLAERGEEKKYHLKHRFINNLAAEKYINLSITGTAEIRDRCGNQNDKRVFTKAEIEELKVELDTDLNDFKLIEVED